MSYFLAQPNQCLYCGWFSLNNFVFFLVFQAADLISRIAVVMRKCEEEKLMGHLGIVLYITLQSFSCPPRRLQLCRDARNFVRLTLCVFSYCMFFVS